MTKNKLTKWEPEDFELEMTTMVISKNGGLGNS